jgi:hypothetical protein
VSDGKPKYLGHVLKVGSLRDGTATFDVIGKAIVHDSGDIVIEPASFADAPQMVIFHGSLVDAMNRHKDRLAGREKRDTSDEGVAG